MILVTPKLAKPIKPADIKLPTDAIIEPSSAEFFLEGRIEGRQQGGARPPPQQPRHALRRQAIAVTCNRGISS